MIKLKVSLKNQYFLEIFSLFVVMLIAYKINVKYNYVAGILLISYGLITYIVVTIKNKDLFDMSAVILAAWVCPLGLALFRIASYQKPWELETWISFFLLPACFIVGFALRKKILDMLTKFASSKKIIKYFKAESKEEIIFKFALIWFLFATVTLFAKWYAAGQLPLFSDQYDAYATFISSANYFNMGRVFENIPVISNIYFFFLSKGWIFFYPMWIVPALLSIYYKHSNKRWKKIISIAISLTTILYTLLVVSRELFLMIMVTLAATLYYLYNKKAYIVGIIIVATISGYAFLSYSRNVSTEDINQVMYITENPNYNPNKSNEVIKKPTGKIDKTDTVAENNKPITYSKPLPGIVVWIYGYFTSGYDNMNYLVKTLDKHTYGIMQLNPLFVITGPENIRNMPSEINQPKYQVAPGLTIYTFMKDSYIDFGVMGVVTAMLFWGLLFGLFEEVYKKYRNGLCLIIYACFIHHIVFISFVSWMTHFSYLFSIGIIILLYLIMKYSRFTQNKQNIS